MKKTVKSISLFLSILIFVNLVLPPISTFAQSTEGLNDLENQEYGTSKIEVLHESKDEKLYVLNFDGKEYEYHEKYSVVDGSKIIETTTFEVLENGDREQVDYYRTDGNGDLIDVIDYSAFEVPDSNFEIMCGPPCGYIAVIAIRTAVGYALRRTATSATLATVTSVPASRVAPVILSYTPRTVTAANRTFTLRKYDMQHILQRHHMTYFNQNVGHPVNGQTFFVQNTSVSTINHIATQAIQRNASVIQTAIKNGRGSENRLFYTYNGIRYQVQVNLRDNTIRSVYPNTTYIAPR